MMDNQDWRILYIDDDEDDRTLVQAMLAQFQRRKVSLEFAASYTNGLSKLSNGTYSAVLVDYDLGDGTGIDLIRKFVDQGYEAPLILFTGRGSYQVDLEAMQAGATLYLTKEEASASLLERSIRYAIERKQIENQLRQISQAATEDRNRLLAVMEALPVGVSILDARGGVIQTNAAYEALWGKGRPQANSIDDYAAYKASWVDSGQALRPEEWASAQAVLHDKSVIGQYLEIESFDGKRSIVLNSAVPIHDAAGNPTGSAVAVIDVTKQHHSEDKLIKLNRTLRAISNSNQALMRANDERTLLMDVCKIIVEDCGYPLVWVGFAEHDAEKSVRPVAHFGFDPAYIESMQITWADEPRGRGSTGTALRTGKPVRVGDIAADPNFEPWRDQAVELGYAASLALPITQDEEPIGVLNIYSTQVDAFSEDEIKLLSELAGDLSLGLSTLKLRRAHEDAEENLRLALAAGQAGAWSWDLNTNTVQWSEQYYRLFGYEPFSIQPTPEAGLSRIHPEDLPKVQAAVNRAMADGTPIDDIHRVIHPDGSIHWLRGISRVFRDARGKPNRMAGIAMDVSELKQAEFALQAAHRQVTDILESIQDAFYSLDQHGTFTYVNRKAAALWGKDPAELLGKNIWEVFPSGKTTESYTKIQQALRDQQPVRYESYSAYIDQWVEIHIYPSDQGISVYFQDITQRKRAEQAQAEFARQLEQSNRALEDFAFVAAHDLQEPLRKINSFGDMLKSRLGEEVSVEALEYLFRMQSAATRMQDMLDSLLAYSRISNQDTRLQPVDLHTLISDILSDLDWRISAARAKIEFSPLPTVHADAAQMRQLFQNLIANAIKFHREDVPPLVKITAREEPDGCICITIEDNGIGFEERYANYLFKPFHRLNPQSRYEGNGMGLAICQKIVERHRGSISVKSRPGEGSKFFVALPQNPG